jgi:hypothetical protein
MAGSTGFKMSEDELPVTLRQLPGYATPAPVQPAVVQPATVVVPPSSGRYQTRERLYYEPLTTETQNLRTAGKTQSVVSRLADEAPPSMSLHDFGGLTPERKYIRGESVAEEGIPSEPKSPIRMEVDSAPVVPSEGNWVTVFGFTGGQSAAVLTYFKKLGAVEAAEVGQGNWIHLQYATLWAAQKALAKNGSVLPGGSMIGVIPTDRAREQVSRAADSFMSPIKSEIRRNSQDGEGSIFVRPSMMSPAPLAATLHVNRPMAKNIRDMPVPQVLAEDSLVTKVFGYVFGW